MLTLKEIVTNKINTLNKMKLKGYFKDKNQFTIHSQEFVGADIEYYSHSHQTHSYSLIVRYNEKNKLNKIIIAYMPCIDGSWGNGTYYDISDNESIENIINTYVEKCNNYVKTYSQQIELV